MLRANKNPHNLCCFCYFLFFCSAILKEDQIRTILTSDFGKIRKFYSYYIYFVYDYAMAWKQAKCSKCQKLLRPLGLRSDVQLFMTYYNTPLGVLLSVSTVHFADNLLILKCNNRKKNSVFSQTNYILFYKPILAVSSYSSLYLLILVT